MSAAPEDYRSVRQRLWNPPNAKNDPGIDLKRIPESQPFLHAIAAKPPSTESEVELYAEPDVSAEEIIDLPKIPLIGAAPLSRTPVIEPPPNRTPTIAECVHAVAGEFRVPYHELISERRTAEIVGPRQIAAALANRLTLKSFPAIGRGLGGRDHTTILHAIRKKGYLIEAVASDMGDSFDPLQWAQAIKQLVDLTKGPAPCVSLPIFSETFEKAKLSTKPPKLSPKSCGPSTPPASPARSRSS